MPNDPEFLQLGQHGETNAVSFLKPDEPFYYRFAYARSADSRSNDDTGQDYLALCKDNGRLAFVVCDGVSQSFFGDLAAEFLGKNLVQYMYKLSTPLVSGESTHQHLAQYLQEISEIASQEIAAYRYPDEMPGMLQVVLEKKRQMGSESTFVAGIIDLANDWYSLAWMGDSRLRLWSTNGEITAQLGDNFHTRERWSSRKGLVGELHIFSGVKSEIKHLMAYSDGLAVLDRAIHADGCSNAALDMLIEEARQQPTSDDTSLFEWWSNIPYFETSPAKPAGFQQKELVCEWQPVENASRYEIALYCDDMSKAAVCWEDAPAAAFTKEQLKVASRVCIRAWNIDEPGEKNCTPLIADTKEGGPMFPEAQAVKPVSRVPVETPIKAPQTPADKNAKVSSPPSTVRRLSKPAAPPPRALSPTDPEASQQSIQDWAGETPSKKRAAFWPVTIRIVTILTIVVIAFVLLSWLFGGTGGPPGVLPLTATPQAQRPQVTVTQTEVPTAAPTATKAATITVVVSPTLDAVTASPITTTTDTAQTPSTTVASTVVDTITPITTTEEAPVVTAHATVEVLTIPTVTFDAAAAQIITAQNIERLVGMPVEGLHPEQKPLNLLFATTASDEPGAIWNALVLYPINAPAPAEVYEIDAAGKWSLIDELAPLRVAAFTSGHAAGVARTEYGDQAVSLWKKKDGMWAEESEIAMPTRRICALAFAGNDLIALEPSDTGGTITIFKNGSGAEADRGTIPLFPIYDISSNPNCSLVTYTDADARTWLAGALDKWLFIVDLSSPDLTPDKKAQIYPILHIEPNYRGGWWVGIQNALIPQYYDSDPYVPITTFYSAFAVNETGGQSLLVTVSEGKLFAKCGFIDFSAYQHGSKLPTWQPLEAKFCDANKVYFTPDGKFMVTISADGNVFIWFSKEQ